MREDGRKYEWTEEQQYFTYICIMFSSSFVNFFFFCFKHFLWFLNLTQNALFSSDIHIVLSLLLRVSFSSSVLRHAILYLKCVASNIHIPVDTTAQNCMQNVLLRFYNTMLTFNKFHDNFLLLTYKCNTVPERINLNRPPFAYVSGYFRSIVYMWI